MIACPLCDALFTRYEIALSEQFDFLLEPLRAALSEHGKQVHTTEMLINSSMYFTSLNVYRRWLQAQLNPGAEVQA